MGIIDIKARLADFKTKINNLNIGFNKEEKKISIQALDKSIHLHYHNEIGLSDEIILNLPDEEVGKLIKHRSFLNLKAAIKDKPEEMQKYLAMYNSTALVAGTASVTTENITSVIMPSGDFIRSLPTAIEKSSMPDLIFVGVDGKKYSGEVKLRRKAKP